MPAAITGRDSTARYSAMRGPTAAWRAIAQGGPHQEAMAISLRYRLLAPDDQRVRRIMIRRYESKMAGYAFGSNPPCALRYRETASNSSSLRTQGRQLGFYPPAQTSST
jgi:hypothetical protein